MAFKPRRPWGVIGGSPAVVTGSLKSTQAAVCGWVREGHCARAAEDQRLAGGRRIAWLLDSGAVSALFLTRLGGPQNVVTQAIGEVVDVGRRGKWPRVSALGDSAGVWQCQ